MRKVLYLILASAHLIVPLAIGSCLASFGELSLDRAANLAWTSVLMGFTGLLIFIMLTLSGVVKYRGETDSRFDWISALGLFGYILPTGTRARIFTPTYEDLKSDYLETRRLRAPWKRRLLAFCFTVRAVIMFAECVHVIAADRAVQFMSTIAQMLWRM